MTPLPAQYDTAAVEKKWQEHWLKHRTYAWNPDTARKDSYVIDTPPPTVSGMLHMGHVFSYTQADFIARFQRMTGKNVFYPMGFDDNGLPTERLVEKTKKIRAADMSREAFIAECLSVSEAARQEFRHLFQSIALSIDWDQEYHTISDASRRLSQLSFLDLIAKGHAYRKLQPMLWDPIDQTAIAQAEVVDKEMPSTANEIYFTVAGTGEKLLIMTTRPELLPACVALFFHPDDARYQHLKGHHADVPLCGFEVPIYADDTVEPDKGTGLMMCCTFGDEADIVKWKRHDLPTRIILNKYAKLDFTGRDIALDEGLAEKLTNKKTSNPDPKNPGAREIILAELEAAGLLKDKKPITHAVKTAERSGAVLELIPTNQWFVRVTDKKEALKARAAECHWNPEWMKIRMDQWIDGLNWDWCISRQRYFGVPFPVWYKFPLADAGNHQPVYANIEDLPVNPITTPPKRYKVLRPAIGTSDTIPSGWIIEDENGIECRLYPDIDVIDTWATSSISPQLSAHGITEQCEEPKRFASLFPADLRPQAHEIIRTWAFYTLVKSHLHNDQIPWHNLMISGWCLSEDKSKMSKSKGNVVTPVALIEERGTDAVRYWAATSRLGQDTAFSPDLLKIGKKLVGKLWNATQFAAIHLAKFEANPTNAATDPAITEILDRWILARLGETIAAATEAFGRYEYAEALDTTNQFFWTDFCDNYLELIKKRVYNEDGSAAPAAQASAVHTLYYVLDGILKLYAPVIPHVTEELYSHIFPADYAAKGSVHAMGQWPKTADYLPAKRSAEDLVAMDFGAAAKQSLEAVRKVKSDAKRSIKTPVTHARVAIDGALHSRKTALASLHYDLMGAGNIEVLEWTEGVTGTVDITLAAEADAA